MSFITQGFHHATLVSSDANKTLRFYRDILGLRLVKKTVNFDMPETYHLYFGDQTGAPGTLLTFFEWPGAPRGAWGVGGIHHIALHTEDEQTQLKWKRWLTEHGVDVAGPYNRGYFKSIYFKDPDGQVIEIATAGPGFTTDEPIEALGQRTIQPAEAQLPTGRDEALIAAQTYAEPVSILTPDMTLSSIHHITGHTDDLVAAGEFYEQALGLKLVKKTVNQDAPDILHYFWANYDGTRVLPASDMTLFGVGNRGRRAHEGVGQTHHIAFRAENEEQLGAWREHLLSERIAVSEIRDRSYFKSIYFRSPDGLLVEIASDTPGFSVDEPVETLGEALKLPSWLEPKRSEIEEKIAVLA
jgi:glyoxalase family protein